MKSKDDGKKSRSPRPRKAARSKTSDDLPMPTADYREETGSNDGLYEYVF